MFVGRKFKIVLADVLALQSKGRYYLFLTTVLSHAPHPLQWRINRRPCFITRASSTAMAHKSSSSDIYIFFHSIISNFSASFILQSSL